MKRFLSAGLVLTLLIILSVSVITAGNISISAEETQNPTFDASYTTGENEVITNASGYNETDDTALNGEESQTVENVTNPVKDIKLKETTIRKPWSLAVFIGIPMLIIPVVYIVIYLLATRKKAN